MMCDVRELHPEDRQTLWLMMRPFMSSGDYRSDGNQWSVNVENVSGPSWRFEVMARQQDDRIFGVYFSYYPPNAGRIRFDTPVEDDVILRELRQCLVDYGHLGKNRLSSFEEPRGEHRQPVGDRGEKKLSWWQRLFGEGYSHP